VTRYVPAFHFDLDPSWAPSITVRDLLTHTSGMSDFLVSAVPDDQKTDAALLSFLTTEFGADDYLMVPPGTFWNYSNPNYYLAGLIRRADRRVPYRALLKRRIFDPLCMRRTLFLAPRCSPTAITPPGRTSWTRPSPARSCRTPTTTPGATGRVRVVERRGSGQVRRFLMDGRAGVLPAELRGAMQAPQVNLQTGGDLQSYGYGLVVQPGIFVGSSFYATKVVWHNGDIPGFSGCCCICRRSGSALSHWPTSIAWRSITAWRPRCRPWLRSRRRPRLRICRSIRRASGGHRHLP